MVRLLSAGLLAAFILGVTPLVGVDPLGAQVSAPGQNSLLPGDIIRVQIWREESLSGEVTVDEKGSVVLPLLGSMQVVGITPDSLITMLVGEYGKYLVNPAVNITLLRRVNVIGEVRVPGQYAVDATNSVADLIAKAGGVTPSGNAEDILLVRDGKDFRINGMVSLQAAGIRSGDQIIVGKRGWWARNFQSVVSVASLVGNVAVIVITAR